MELPFRAATLDSVAYLKDGETSYTSIDADKFGLFGSHFVILFSRNAFTDPGDTELDHPFPFRFIFTTKADEELKTAAVADDPETAEDEAVAAVYQTSRSASRRPPLPVPPVREQAGRELLTSKPVEVPFAFRHLVASIARIR